MKNKKGFTLVELIVVIVILGILIAILVPGLTKYIERAKEKQYLIYARDIELAAKGVYAEAYAEGYPLAVIKLNYTSNLQKTSSGGHFCLLEAIYYYKEGQINGCEGLNKDNSLAKKYYHNLMDLIETGNAYLAGTTWIFFDKDGNIVSNSNHKIAGQNAETTLNFKNKSQKDKATVKYTDDKNWKVELK